MNRLFVVIILILLSSCNKNISGTYNTNYLNDKSAFFEIKLNSDNTLEKKEIHTISIFFKGKWLKDNNKVICYLDSSDTGFPADTILFKIKGKKLFPIRNGVVNTKFYLKKE